MADLWGPGVLELRPTLARTPTCLDPSASAPPPTPLCLSNIPFAWRDIPQLASIVIGRQPSPPARPGQWLHLTEHLAHRRAPQRDTSKIIKIMARGYQIAIRAIHSRFFCLSGMSGFKPLSVGQLGMLSVIQTTQLYQVFFTFISGMSQRRPRVCWALLWVLEIQTGSKGMRPLSSWS